MFPAKPQFVFQIFNFFKGEILERKRERERDCLKVNEALRLDILFYSIYIMKGRVADMFTL